MSRSISVILADIAANNAQINEEREKAKALHANLAGFRVEAVKRARRRCDTQLTEFLESCSEVSDPTPFGWGNDDWDGFQPGEDAPIAEKIRVGGRNESNVIAGELKADLPTVANLFSADGPLMIMHTDDSKADGRATMQSLALRIALSMPGQVRFSLLDPKGAGQAFPLRGFLGREILRPPGRTPTDELNDIVEDIRRINERVIGVAPRFSALSAAQRAGEMFEVIFVADFPKAYLKDPRALEALVKIANAGPRTGRHVILETNRNDPLPYDFKMDQFENAITVDLSDLSFRTDYPPESADQEAMIKTAFDGARKTGGGDWNSIVRPSELMTESASLRVSTPVGERLKFWLGENDEGKPSAHAMIAGQTGSGKSYLLHVIITGLAARYSPEELRFTLIDGKQGVEFEAYRTLPHADVVCLRSAPALARSVLEDFVTEMEERYRLFQDAGVVKLSDYRDKTGEVMPRRLLIVDEFQQILDGDPEAGAALLGKLLEKGRAAGMHAVLGSQTFEQRGLPQSALTHIHSWASLSLSESYARSLQVFGAEGKRLIQELGSNGEVVLNDEGGRNGANSRGAVARLRKKNGEDLLAGIISDISEHPVFDGQPIVLSGREAALVSDNPHLMQKRKVPLTPVELQKLARRKIHEGGFGLETWNKADMPVPLWLGRRFDVRGHALCALKRAPGQNLLVLGSDTETRHRMVCAALAGFANLLNSDTMKVTFINGLRDEMPGSGMIDAGLDKLDEAGFNIDRPDSKSIAAVLQTLADSLDEKNSKSPTQILVIAEPDYLYDLHGGADRFSAPKSGPTVALRKILTRGPQSGVHTVFMASGLTSLQLVLSASREASTFNHLVVQQMNEEDSMVLFSSLMAARLNIRADHPFTSLHVDKIAGTRNATLFHSYGANRMLGADQGVSAMTAEIKKISVLKD